MTKAKREQFNTIWNKGGKSKDTLVQKVTARGLDPTEKHCFEYFMGWIKPTKVTKWGKVVWTNPMWSRSFRWRMKNARHRKKQHKGRHKGKNGKPRK